MEWYYAAEGRQCGPVSETQLEELVRSGKLLPTSLVWHQGMPDWQPYGVVHAVASPVISSATERCIECGQAFSTDDLLRYQNPWVCAKCKPVFFQRVQEGAGPPASLLV